MRLSASAQHRPLARTPQSSSSSSPTLPLALTVAVVALAGLAALPVGAAAALPARAPLVARRDCAPVLSGLVQEIQSSSEPDVLWKAVTREATAQDGVKAVKVPRKSVAPLPLDLEWFVELTDEPGVYSISSSAAVTACSDLAVSSTSGNNPFAPNPQRAFAPVAEATTACSPAHLFRLSCTTCDAHEDAAHGCLMESVSKGQCVELLPAKKSGDRPHLGWGDCVTESSGWKGKAAREERRQRQLWDIIPS